MGGQQGFPDPGFQPGMFPPPEFRQHMPDPFPPASPPYGRSRYSGRRYRPRAGSAGWVVLWVVRLAFLAFICYVAFSVFHGATSMP